MTKEDREQFDRDLEKATFALRGEDAPKRSATPSWWRGEADAGQSMLAAARAAGFSVEVPT